MGIRLGIDVRKNFTEIENKYYRTKLYGYEVEGNLLSYEFLVCIGKFEGDEYFGYSGDNEIVLDKKQFELFCKLYDLDLINSGVEEYSFINDKDIKELLNGDYRYYILNWG